MVVELVALEPVMVYVVAGDISVGVPEMRPVVVLKLKPEGSDGAIA